MDGFFELLDRHGSGLNRNFCVVPLPVRISEKIAARFRKAIARGVLGRGERLPAERELARQFETSRVSVREAYRSLEAEGLIVTRRGAEGGAFVGQADYEPVARSLAFMLRLGRTSHEELTEARLLIEPMVARLAARRATAADLDSLQELVRRHSAAIRGKQDPRRFDLQFHRLLAEAAKNLPLKIIMNSLGDLMVESISGLPIAFGTRKRSVHSHIEIVDAISRQDEEEAHKLMLRHVTDIQERLRELWLRRGGSLKPGRQRSRGKGRKRLGMPSGQATGARRRRVPARQAGREAIL